MGGTSLPLFEGELTTNSKCERLPFCLAVEPTKQNGLKKRSYINSSHIHAFSKRRLLKKLGSLSSDEMSDLNDALRLILDL